jgi:hypothetical protein
MTGDRNLSKPKGTIHANLYGIFRASGRCIYAAFMSGRQSDSQPKRHAHRRGAGDKAYAIPVLRCGRRFCRQYH